VLRVNTTVVAVVAPESVEPDPLDGVRGANVRVVRPEPGAPALDRAVAAWDEARRTGSPFLVHDADPLAWVATAWAERFDGTGVAGDLEVAVAETQARWRARSLDLPDYYLVVEPEALPPVIRHWYLGVLNANSPARVVTGGRDTPVVDQLARLRAGRWWPDLDRILAGIDRIVPDLAGTPGRTGQPVPVDGAVDESTTDRLVIP
jgi:hypothetical protein